MLTDIAFNNNCEKVERVYEMCCRTINKCQQQNLGHIAKLSLKGGQMVGKWLQHICGTCCCNGEDVLGGTHYTCVN